jgi:ATP synthase protein I
MPQKYGARSFGWGLHRSCVRHGSSGAVLCRKRCESLTMSEQNKPDDRASAGSGPSSDAELSAKLRHLDTRLSDIKSDRATSAAPKGRLAADGTAMAHGMKLVSEFVAGIVAGGILGWLIDRFAGIQPFGLLMGLMFGFAAGLRNLYRATSRPSSEAPGPPKGPPN